MHTVDYVYISKLCEGIDTVRARSYPSAWSRANGFTVNLDVQSNFGETEMIFEIRKSQIVENRHNDYLVPMFHNDAWDLFNMLRDVFPQYSKGYSIVCFNGHDNAVEVRHQ